MACLSANDLQLPKVPLHFGSLSSYDNGTNLKLLFPWSDAPTVSMEKVFSKNDYSLWKCEAQVVTNFPGCKIQGNTYNYFVYKNNRFHLTVTEMNKQCVFNFFNEQNKNEIFPEYCSSI